MGGSSEHWSLHDKAGLEVYALTESETLTRTDRGFLGLGTQTGLHGGFETQVCSSCPVVLQQAATPLPLTTAPSAGEVCAGTAGHTGCVCSGWGQPSGGADRGT